MNEQISACIIGQSSSYTIRNRYRTNQCATGPGSTGWRM